MQQAVFTPSPRPRHRRTAAATPIDYTDTTPVVTAATHHTWPTEAVQQILRDPNAAVPVLHPQRSYVAQPTAIAGDYTARDMGPGRSHAALMYLKRRHLVSTTTPSKERPVRQSPARGPCSAAHRAHDMRSGRGGLPTPVVPEDVCHPEELRLIAREAVSRRRAEEIPAARREPTGFRSIYRALDGEEERAAAADAETARRVALVETLRAKSPQPRPASPPQLGLDPDLPPGHRARAYPAPPARAEADPPRPDRSRSPFPFARGARPQPVVLDRGAVDAIVASPVDPSATASPHTPVSPGVLDSHAARAPQLAPITNAAALPPPRHDDSPTTLSTQSSAAVWPADPLGAVALASEAAADRPVFTAEVGSRGVFGTPPRPPRRAASNRGMAGRRGTAKPSPVTASEELILDAAPTGPARTPSTEALPAVPSRRESIAVEEAQGSLPRAADSAERPSAYDSNTHLTSVPAAMPMSAHASVPVSVAASVVSAAAAPGAVSRTLSGTSHASLISVAQQRQHPAGTPGTPSEDPEETARLEAQRLEDERAELHRLEAVRVERERLEAQRRLEEEAMMAWPARPRTEYDRTPPTPPSLLLPQDYLPADAPLGDLFATP